MSGHVHLVSGSIGVMSSTLLTSFAGWIFWVISTHRWPNSQIGVSTSLIAALTVISIIAGQPIATTLLARVPRSPHPRALIRTAMVTAASLSFVLAWVGVAVLPSSLEVVRSPGIALAFVTGSVAMSVGIILDAASIAVRRPQTMVERNGLFGFGKLILVGCLAAPVHFWTAPTATVVCWTSIGWISCAWSFTRLSRAWESSPFRTADTGAPSAPAWSQLRSGFEAQILGTLGGSLPPQVLPLLVIAMLGSTKASWFSITWLLGGLCFMISPAVSQALLADASHDPEQLAAKTRFATIVSFLLLAGPLVLYVAGGRYILLVFGSSYSTNGRTLLAVLALSAIPDLITNMAIAHYRVLERLWAAASINVTIAVVTVVGTILLLPHVGIIGAGWAWTAGQTSGCVVMVVLIIRDRIRGRSGVRSLA